jgi:N-acetyl-anhydromuramyl-L-alanine amidase AmpD
MKRGLFVLTSLSISAAAFAQEPKIGERLPRRGDEIVVCGQLYHTTTKVVLWMDPGGFDAYRVGRRFGPDDSADARAKATASDNSNASERGSARYNLRTRGLTKQQVERVRGGGWDVPTLQQAVDQFVIHFDVCGTSRRCFEVLQDKRGLSVHFMLDIDGTIYQTLDLKERAWHATKANDRSIGIEVANMGAYPLRESNPLDEWYRPDSEGGVRLVIPGAAKDGDPVAAVAAGLRPIRGEKITGAIHGGSLVQYDFTPQQYEALARLTATLCTVFPKIRCDYPRDDKGTPITHELPAGEYDKYHGVLGHYHVQDNKVDPGPAFQWDRVIGEAQRLMATK